MDLHLKRYYLKLKCKSVLNIS